MKAKFIALAALVLGLASCQQDFDAPVQMNGEVDFQLSVAANEVTRGLDADGKEGHDSAHGAIDYLSEADWTNVDLRYSLEVYDKADDYFGKSPIKDRQVIIVDKYEPVKFDLRLVPNRDYHFVVFADFVQEGATVEVEEKTMLEHQSNLGLHHTIGANLGEITIKADGINDECTDAYFATKDIKITNSASQDITLKRPYGKVRVIATDLAELNLNVNPKFVHVVYTAAHPAAFNAVTGAISAKYETAQYKYEYANITKESLANHVYTAGYDAKKATNANGVERHTHMTLFTDYILAEDQHAPIQFTMTVYDQDASPIKETIFSTDIPVKRNMLTTIIGNVLTTATDITVTIDDNFAGENEVNIDPVDTTEEFAQALADAAEHEYAIIELTGDVEWATGAAHGSTPWIGEDAKTKVLTINGDGHKITATGSGVGPIRMANGGTIVFNNVVIEDKSVSYNESAWELCYLEFAGNLEFNNCEFVNAVMMCGGTPNNNTGCNVTFNKCSFNSNKSKEYAVWVSGDNAYFNECAFAGPRALKVHEAYGSEVSEVVVDKCTFTNITEKPGIALGTLNAETAVTIKNSSFTNCQPGDQGLYIYESDTDVTTFDFTEEKNVVEVAATPENIAQVIKTNVENIVIKLTEDTTIDVGANDPRYYFGGNNTNTITIDGAKVTTTAATGAGDNTYALTFNHKNSDWNYIRLNNDNAKWVIKNVKLSNTGNNNGPWNRHDIRFYNDIVLENVTSDKAIALLADADLTNIVISDVHPNNSEAYALWITAEGQTVNIKDCAFLAHESKTTDRGIKIDNQYVDEGEAKVTLNVDGLKVKSQKKAAIVVKSQAGADINLANVDISNVYADTYHAVWVDEAAAAYADLVNVNGGHKMVEGNTEVAVVRDSEAMATAIAKGAATIYLNKGSYILPSAAKGKTVNFVGVGDAKDTTITVTKVGNGGENCDYALDGSNATFENLTIATNGSTFIGYARCNGTYKNCIIDNTYTLYGKSTFEGCTFNVSGDKYNVWTWGAPEATFTNCTFNCDGKSMLLYGMANTKLTMNNCVFNDNGTISGKAAIEIGNDYNTAYELTVNNATVKGFDINTAGINTNTTLWANKNSMGQDKLNVVVDGVDVY